MGHLEPANVEPGRCTLHFKRLRARPGELRAVPDRRTPEVAGISTNAQGKPVRTVSDVKIVKRCDITGQHSNQNLIFDRWV